MKLNLKSVDDASILRKFAVLFVLTSVFPIVVLVLLWYVLNSRPDLKINQQVFTAAIYLVAVFSFIGFIYMRESLVYLRRLAGKFQDALKEDPPSPVDIGMQGNTETVQIASSFNDLVKRLESNINEIETVRFMFLQALDREQTISRTDYLTGIANRRVFYEQAEMEIHKSRRYGHVFTALLIDVDNFKDVNDTQGHDKGDVLLCEIAKLIKQNTRVTDIVARIGGDEFAILLTETGNESLEIIVPRLQAKLLDVMARNAWPVTFSIGVATYKAVPSSVDAIMRKADDLMYAVKRSGKNSIKYEVVTNG